MTTNHRSVAKWKIALTHKSPYQWCSHIRKYSQKESEKSEKESKLSNYILTINMYQMMPLIRCDWMIAEKIDFLLEKEEEL